MRAAAAMEKILADEGRARSATERAREERILYVIKSDPDLTFGVLCERFARDDEWALRWMLRCRHVKIMLDGRMVLP